MHTPSTVIFMVLSMATVTSPVNASDVRLGVPALRLGAPSAAPAVSELVPSLLLAGETAAQQASSVGSTSLTEGKPTLRGEPADRRAQRKMARAGYGLAAGLVFLASGVMLASQTRPNDSSLSSDSGVCYQSQQGEKTFLYAATGFMAVGLTVSSGMLAWLIGMRRAHPGVRPSPLTRGLQGLFGIAVASATTTLMVGAIVGCASS